MEISRTAAQCKYIIENINNTELGISLDIFKIIKRNQMVLLLGPNEL